MADQVARTGAAMAHALASASSSDTCPSNADDAVDVTPRLRLQADESTLLLQAATAGLGLGLACLPDWLAGAALASGALVRVLPGWCAGTVTTTLLMPRRRGQLPGVRAAVEFLAQHVARHHGSGADDAHA